MKLLKERCQWPRIGSVLNYVRRMQTRKRSIDGKSDQLDFNETLDSPFTWTNDAAGRRRPPHARDQPCGLTTYNYNKARLRSVNQAAEGVDLLGPRVTPGE